MFAVAHKLGTSFVKLCAFHFTFTIFRMTVLGQGRNNTSSKWQQTVESYSINALTSPHLPPSSSHLYSPLFFSNTDFRVHTKSGNCYATNFIRFCTNPLHENVGGGGWFMSIRPQLRVGKSLGVP